MWAPADLAFEIVADQTDDPVVTITVATPVGELMAMAEVELVGRRLTLRGFHMHGANANAIGPANLRVLADTVIERMDLDEIVIEGAVRTSGAGPGRAPGRLRFARRSHP